MIFRSANSFADRVEVAESVESRSVSSLVRPVALTTPLTSAAAMSAAIDAAPSVPIHDGTEEPETVDIAPAAAVKPELVVEAPPDVAETPGSGVTNPTDD